MKIAVFVPVEMDCVQDPKIFTGNDAEEKAAKAFFDHTGVEYSIFLAAEDQEGILAASDTIGTKIITNQPYKSQERYENLDEDDVDYVKQVLNNLNDAKYYADQASDKTFQLPGKQGEQIGDYLSEIHQQLVLVETMIIDTYPQVVEE